MKFYIIIIVNILFLLPSFATCSIDNSTVCSIENFKNPTSIAQPINIRNFSNPKLKPINSTNNTKPFGDFTSSENNSSYNSSCQFGVCLQTQSTPRIQQPKQ